MCDTAVVVRPDRVLFAKNSDRDPNEAQFLDWQPRRRHPPAARLRCTWVEIPQVEQTWAVLLSRPFWMWGAEMGANERRVVIGNEAVFTRQPLQKIGLTGMDLVRLALERADSARQACEVITGLLAEHGQGGGCGYENRRFTYHNSFLIADPGGAFVLETAGRHWAVEEVHGPRSISNGLTIPAFARQHSDFLKTRVSACRLRQRRTQALAEGAAGAGDLFAMLRDHGPGRPHPRYSVLNGALNAPCAHAGGLAAATQTTASWVSVLGAGPASHWVTATAAPCVSLFKPVQVDQPLDLGPPPSDTADDRSLWWRHERLHRTALRAPEELRPLFIPQRDAIEARWLDNPPEPQQAFHEADELLARWTDAVSAHTVRDVRPLWVRRYWAKRSRRAGLAVVPDKQSPERKRADGEPSAGGRS
jgi:secernin